MFMLMYRAVVVRLFLALLSLNVLFTGQSRADQSVYTDSLQNTWSNWSWATVNLANTAQHHSGTSSASVSSTNWQALYLHHAPQAGSSFSALTFWINGGSGGQSVQVQATSNGVALTPVILPALPTNSWRQETVTFASLGAASISAFDGFWIQVRDSGLAPTFYVDDIVLVANGVPPPAIALTSPAQNSSYVIPATINLAASVTTNAHLINKVQFYQGTTLLGEDTSPPYSLSWSGMAPGAYTVFARLVYDTTNTLDSAAATVSVVTSAGLAITVDAAANRHPISPLIYGTAFAGAAQLADLNAPLNRSGGNSETRYNWQLNAHNKANDWYFESLDDGSSTPGNSADQFVSDSKNGGAEPMLTVPMIGWTTKLGAGRARLSSFSIAKYGPQNGNDWQWFPDAGNGVVTNSSVLITNNDPNDASFPTNSSFAQAWLQHLTNRWGVSTNGGVRYYFMDNEHTIWHSTHRDIHPIGTTMTEIRDKFFDYAGKVKAVDPAAIVLGPEEWGWSGYFWSGYDQQWSGANNNYNQSQFPDRGTNGGWDYLPWLLDQLHRRDTNTSQRLLDYFTVHYYPQGGEFGNDVSTSMQLLRNRSTRSLWDTNYVDQSWINSVVKLIPRLKQWVAAYYPGTRIGLTEYNWGAENHINGATAQADIFGILGREGADVATRWTTPTNGSPAYNAMKLYRNYDGSKSAFGDVSVAAAVSNPDNVSAFAATRSADGALTLIVINKQLATAAAVSVNVNNFLPNGTGQLWQLTAVNTISNLGPFNFTGTTITNTLPPQSITLFVVSPGTAPALRAGAVAGGNFDLWLDGTAGQKYVLQATTDFVTWSSLQTNILATNSFHYVVPATGNSYRFYRARWTQ